MIRKIARPMLASVYIADGVDSVVNSSEHVESSERFLKQVRSVVPAEYQRYVPKDAELVAQALGGTKVGAGALYALGKAPRFAAGTLAITAIPTLLGRHAFWEADSAEEKSARRNGALTSVALLGGLFLATADTAGKPGLAWRTKKAAQTANKKVQAALPTQSESEKALSNAQNWIQDTTEKVTTQAQEAGKQVSNYVDDNKDDWIDTASKWVDNAKETTGQFLNSAGDKTSDWLDEVNKDTKQARKAVVKKANKAQQQADKALQQASKDIKSGRARKRADKKAEKLQKRANKAVDRARKRLDK
ncbi:DoxX family protein [Corynebacterium cystitidis]|uniref:DoxX family protein n=1 Tax=Corynebacterium cystitidis TaxID=35757 RepID=UPI00211E4555|nr:DoxX family membrane protein [Corynebacterium cystitidis]